MKKNIHEDNHKNYAYEGEEQTNPKKL